MATSVVRKKRWQSAKIRGARSGAPETLESCLFLSCFDEKERQVGPLKWKRRRKTTNDVSRPTAGESKEQGRFLHPGRCPRTAGRSCAAPKLAAATLGRTSASGRTSCKFLDTSNTQQNNI
jgi:hypothetical protein